MEPCHDTRMLVLQAATSASRRMYFNEMRERLSRCRFVKRIVESDRGYQMKLTPLIGVLVSHDDYIALYKKLPDSHFDLEYDWVRYPGCPWVHTLYNPPPPGQFVGAASEIWYDTA